MLLTWYVLMCTTPFTFKINYQFQINELIPIHGKFIQKKPQPVVKCYISMFLRNVICADFTKKFLLSFQCYNKGNDSYCLQLPSWLSLRWEPKDQKCSLMPSYSLNIAPKSPSRLFSLPEETNANSSYAANTEF